MMLYMLAKGIPNYPLYSAGGFSFWGKTLVRFLWNVMGSDWRKLMASDFQPTSWTRTYRSARKASNLSLICYAGELLLPSRNECSQSKTLAIVAFLSLFFGTRQINARKLVMFLAAYGFCIHFPVELKNNNNKPRKLLMFFLNRVIFFSIRIKLLYNYKYWIKWLIWQHLSSYFPIYLSLLHTLCYHQINKRI